jgi:putative redox protein
MPTAKITYTADLHCSATHLQSGTIITTDAPTDNQGKGEAFSPTDLLAVSLATCMITTMGIVANRDNIPLNAAEIDLTKVMATEGPRRVSKIEVYMSIPAAGISDADRQKLINTANACPVSKSLHPDVEVDLRITWLD